MTILLLCNVGTRDVQLDDLTVLPAEVCDSRGNPVARLAGAYLRQKDVYAQHRAGIHMPMVEKALQYISPQDKTLVRIVLFATDQPETIVERFRNNDTRLYAELMRDVLFERYERAGLSKKQIVVQSTSSNPADYDVMYDFYRDQLPQFAAQLEENGRVYLLIAGGTPQMNTMLLFVGSEVFGGYAQPIYVSPDRDRAATLDILRQLYAQSLRRNVQVLLDAYAYEAARTLIQQEQSVLEPWQTDLLMALCHYANARRNLDLRNATGAFDLVMQGTRALREDVRALQQEVGSDTEQVKLQETIYLAQIASETGNWADFLARLYRFSEGTLQLLAEQAGIQWGDTRKRSSYKESWWNEHRTLLHGIGLAEAIAPIDKAAEHRAREVDRKSLRLIIETLATQQQHAGMLAALDALLLVDAPVALRNNIVHRFTPISRDEVEQKAGQPVTTVLNAMRTAHHAAFGVPVPEHHPYSFVNRLCLRALGGER